MFEGRTKALPEFLSEQRATGLLIVRDGVILAEHYQYDRRDTHRFVSHSMAKSLVGIAIGMLVAEGKIASLDDLVETYVPALAGSAFGQVSIRHCLRMSSGVAFRETYDGRDDLRRFHRLMTASGRTAAIRAFDTRLVAPGQKFQYATIETYVLGAVVTAITGSSLSAYLETRLWHRIGAESDATWAKSVTDGLEHAGGGFSARLRDYGRLGMMLAGDGIIRGHRVIDASFLLEATDWQRQPPPFHPRRATSSFGYGYHFWTFPGRKRRFALLGIYGQSIFVDPELRLVMVITAVAKRPLVAGDILSRERDALWRGLVATFGSWD